jgi:hypothetical protein
MMRVPDRSIEAHDQSADYDMHSENPVVHGKIMDRLAAEFEERPRSEGVLALALLADVAVRWA